MAQFIVDSIMHNPKILSYAINLDSIDIPEYNGDERIKCINNIGKIICQKGTRIISDNQTQLATNIYSFISLQQITRPDWEILKDEIDKIEPGFLPNYNVHISGNLSTGLVTLINKNLYKEKFSIESESLISGYSLPYHLFILVDSAGYDDVNINKIIYVNIELPKSQAFHEEAIRTLKSKFELLNKTNVGQYRVILTGKFNTETPETLPEFSNLLNGFYKNGLVKGPTSLLTGKQINNSTAPYTKSDAYIYDNYNKFLLYQTLPDLSEYIIPSSKKIMLSVNLPIFAKLEIVSIVEYDLAKVQASFAKLVNVDFVISNIANLESFVREFKSDLTTFKSAYGFMSPDIAEKISQMESKIDANLIRQRNLQAFSEPYVFSNPIKEYTNSIFGSVITGLTVFGSKSSSSDSLIFKAAYNAKPVYIKMFSLNNPTIPKENSGLTYEQKIYKYLMERSSLVQPYYQDYFVKVYDVFKIPVVKFFDQLETLGVKVSGGPAHDKIYYARFRMNALNYTIPPGFIGKDQMVYFTVTEDIQGENYNGFLAKNITNEQIVIESLFDVIYAIYLLNVRLGVIHGDNHFANVLIKPEKKTREYIIDKTTLVRKSNYRICLYDFDLSFLFDNKNLALNEPFNQSIGRTNTLNYAKDVWTLINNIGYLLKYNPTTITPDWKSWFDNMQNNFFARPIHAEPYVRTYMFDLINNVLTQTKEQIDTLYENFQAHMISNSYWNSFCKIPLGSHCTQPDFLELHPELVLKRYIGFYKNQLNFTDANAYYRKYYIVNNLSKYVNKYLKYKEKYLKLKSQLEAKSSNCS